MEESPTAAKRPPKKRLLALLALGSAVFTLGVIELFLQIVGNDVALGNQYRFYQFDPELGWSNAPGEEGVYRRSEFAYPVVNNSLGMRDEEFVERQPGVRRVAVLGDSFTWGVGAADGERFTEVVEDLDPSIKVLNFGVSGYGTVQQYLQLEQVLSLDSDMVVVAFCLANDLLDNVMAYRYGYHKPTAEFNEDGEVTVTGFPLFESQSFGGTLAGAMSNLRTVGLVRQAMRRKAEKAWLNERSQDQQFSLSDRDLYLPEILLSPEKRRMFDIAEALLVKMNARVAEAIGPDRFAVLLVPTKFELGIEEDAHEDSDPDLVAGEMSRRLKEASIPVIDGREVITSDDFWKRDGHWNPGGHEKIGKLLLSELQKRL